MVVSKSQCACRQKALQWPGIALDMVAGWQSVSQDIVRHLLVRT